MDVNQVLFSRAPLRSRQFVILVLLALLGAIFVLLTIDQLPEQVGSHFASDGDPDGWMTRESYLGFILVFLLVYPVAIAFLIGFLPRVMPHWVNIPNRDYWLAPERREESVKFLSAQGAWFGCLLVLIVAGIHYAILVGNLSQPPTLPLSIFLTVLGAFLIGLISWLVVVLRRFRKPE